MSASDSLIELTNAIIDAIDVRTEMSNHALNSEQVLTGLLALLLGPTMLYERLRETA